MCCCLLSTAFHLYPLGALRQALRLGFQPPLRHLILFGLPSNSKSPIGILIKRNLPLRKMKMPLIFTRTCSVNIRKISMRGKNFERCWRFTKNGAIVSMNKRISGKRKPITSAIWLWPGTCYKSPENKLFNKKCRKSKHGSIVKKCKSSSCFWEEKLFITSYRK